MQTLAVDTATSIFPACMDHICKREGFRSPDEGNFRGGWRFIRQEWERVIQKLHHAKLPVVFIGHERQVSLTIHHMDVKRTQPDLPKTGLDILGKLCDCMFHFGFDENEDRIVETKPREDLVVGSKGPVGVTIYAPNMPPHFDAIDEAIKSALGIGYLELMPTIFLYGERNTGKSTFVSTFPDPHFIGTEDTLKYLDVSKAEVDWNDDAGAWVSFGRLCKQAIDEAAAQTA